MSFESKIQIARVRMTAPHAGHISAMGGLFACVIYGVTLGLTNAPVDVFGSSWLGFIWLAVILRFWVSYRIKHAPDQTLHHWNRIHQAFTALFGIAWGSAMWLLPISADRELTITLLGVIAGLTIAGSTMGPADKGPTRAWFVPTLLLEVLFCINDNSPIGLFGGACFIGLIVLLWVQSGLNHRHTGELLNLRFASEAVASARTKALSEAKELGQAKEQFLATMSHEMRTPLHGILGISRLLKNETTDPQARKKLDLQLKAGEHLLRMINDVLDLSRLHARRMNLRPEPTDLLALAQEVADLTQATVQDKSLHIHVQAEKLPPKTRWEVDAPRLKQILINLVGNAAKFTAQGEVRITIRASKKRKKVDHIDKLTFEVIDTGIGIPAEDIERIFMPFQQVSTKKHGNAGGTGLGLSIAVQLCEAMKSQLHCESKEGQGTRFWFTISLPRTIIENTAEASAPHEPSQADLLSEVRTDNTEALKGIIMVVDDNPVNLLIAKAQIEILGLQCQAAESGASALAWLKENSCDLVLLDYHMPRMNGDEVAKRMHSICRDGKRKAMPIIAMTAAYEGLNSFTNQAEIAGELYKPFDEKALLQLLKRYLIPMPESTAVRQEETAPGHAIKIH